MDAMATSMAREATAPPASAARPAQAAKPAAGNEPAAAAAPEDGDGFKPFGKDGLSFLDLIDIINPLQHIPVVSAIYRAATGDSIDPASRVAGDALYFGPFGALAGAINVVVAETTGQDVGGHVLALFSGGPEEGAVETAAGPSAPLAFSGAPPERPVSDAEVAALIADGEPFAAASVGPSETAAPKPRAETASAFGSDGELDWVSRWAQQELAFRARGAVPGAETAGAEPAGSETAAAETARLETAAADPGAVPSARDGGWFTEVMRTAASRYEKATGLALAGPPRMSVQN